MSNHSGLTIRRVNEVAVAKVTGPIVKEDFIASEGQHRTVLVEARWKLTREVMYNGAKTVLLDLSAVPDIDETGVADALILYFYFEGRGVHVVGAQVEVILSLSVVIPDLFRFYATLDEALADTA